MIAKLRRMQFGRRSEKLDRQIEQIELRLEDLQADEGAADAAAAPEAKRPPPPLQDERNGWITMFERFDAGYAREKAQNPRGEIEPPLNPYAHPLLDQKLSDMAAKSGSLQPTLAKRLDLQMRYAWRQWLRFQDVDSYSPESRKNRNDGIDFDLYRYIMLPAYVAANDWGFHEKIADIKSPQRGWFWRPEQLADAWKDGEKPRPTWKDESSDSTK